jgi:mutator family transposase
MRYVAYKDRKAIARDLKPVYRAVNPDAAREAIEAFDEQWGERYPMMAESWRARWEHIHAVPGRTPSRDGPARRLSGHSSWPVPYSVAAVREPPSTDSPAITTTIATPPPPTAIRQVELPA